MNSLSWMLSLSQPAVQVLHNATNTLVELGNPFADHVQMPDRDAMGAISALATVTVALVGIYYFAPKVERFLAAHLFDHLPHTGQLPPALPMRPSSQGAPLRDRPSEGSLPETSNSLSNSQSIFPIQFSDELLTHIFGYLDITSVGRIASVCQLFNRIQGGNSVWFTLLPRVRSLQVDFGLPAKERARKLLAEIPLGNKETRSVCTLNPYNKTISAPDFSPEAFEPDRAFVLALSRPEVPNGSFVVYEFGTRQIPCAVIKSRGGHVCSIYDTRSSRGVVRALIILHLQEHEGTPLQFQEFKVVLTDEQRVEYGTIHDNGQARALRWLKGTQTEDD